MTHSTDRHGHTITIGSRCWLPWGWGVVAAPGELRTLIEYADGQRLEARNTLIEVREVDA